ncbi:PH domain-containing protein [Flavobacterium sp.]|uniref:PH domain-containing protein n=1 Tax=Flavobacterium sp. TaxID=239 RepID=UPI002629E863|nr:PH domain-containing protein [Flavobacterium sp.]
MKRFLSSKSTFTYIFLWAIVLFMIVVLYLGIKENGVALIPIVIVSLVIGFLLWVLLDTRYVIKNHFLLYRSGPIRGRINIEQIQKIKRHSGLYVPVTLKPALDTKGFIITYNRYDDLFISPIKSDLFLEELMKINPKIEII